MPQLDALRVFAVLGVLIHHFVGEGLTSPVKYFPWGIVGVRLFFVLSGFLITGILLEVRATAESEGGNRWHLVRQFYVRRFLRIFPLYYLVIAVTAAINLPAVRELMGWLLTYTLNIKISLQGWFPDHISHFWSLAVEEQFYLLWPWVILFTPRKRLIPSIVAVIAAGPLFRAWVVFTDVNPIAAYTSTPAVFDALGIGSLLAVTLRAHPGFIAAFDKHALVVGLVGATSLILLDATKIEWRSYVVLLDLFIAACCGVLVLKAARGVSGPWGRVLASSPMLYCGRITYGIYVYHLLMPPLLAAVCQNPGFTYSARGWAHFFWASCATMVIAVISWHFFEQPAIRLKRFFEYSDNAGRSGSVSPLPTNQSDLCIEVEAPDRREPCQS